MSWITPSNFPQVNTTESTLLITEPYFNLPNIQETYDQFIFEEYEFESYYRCTRLSCFACSLGIVSYF